MAQDSGRRLSISEVSQRTGVPAHRLRQWEDRFPQLRPKRNRVNRRRYSEDDVAIVRRIKELLRHEGMTTEGARRRLAQELKGPGIPETKEEARHLADEIQAEARELLDLLDRE
jgi:DNA-binding transcriptional MerR regulator